MVLVCSGERGVAGFAAVNVATAGSAAAVRSAADLREPGSTKGTVEVANCAITGICEVEDNGWDIATAAFDVSALVWA
ncbi:hypothetical protein JQV64_11415 [Sulfitobacter geojensis]|nr:hypothetical protein [Sulfitobacter geojensis]MBM1828406.1 hypothetical protein [Sulfitobacter geojensis]